MADYRQDCRFCGTTYYGYHACAGVIEWRKKYEEERQAEEENNQKEWQIKKEQFRNRAIENGHLTDEEVDAVFEWVERDFNRMYDGHKRKMSVLRDQYEQWWDRIEKLRDTANKAYDAGYEDGLYDAQRD